MKMKTRIAKEKVKTMENENLEFLYLDEQDMICSGVKNMDKCIDTMEEMFRLLDIGDYRMGGVDANEHGIKVTFPDKSNIEGMPLNGPDRRFMAMPAYLGGKYHMFGIKTYGSNQNNRAIGLPRSVLMMSLLDVETGLPLAYMSANILSAMRTGAAVGAGVRKLCCKNAKIVTIVGPGTISRYAMEAFMVCCPNLDTIKIKGRGDKTIESFVAYCKSQYPRIKSIHIYDNLIEACKNSDIVFLGATNEAEFEDNPQIESEWIKPGAIVIGASALRIGKSFYHISNCKFVADNYRMYEDWSIGAELPVQKNISSLMGMGYYDAVQEGILKKEQIINMGEIIKGEKTGRDNDKQIILYCVGGMPIEDVAWGFECYMSAKEKGIGTKLKLWDKSAL